MNENESIHIDVERMFPAAARRVKILEELKRFWPSVVGESISRYSRPCVLGVNELVVSVNNDYARQRLIHMKGTILKKLLRLEYKPEGDFVLKVTGAEPQDRNAKTVRSVHRKFKTDEERVKQYMCDAPDTLPEDINYAVSHLKAYLEERFGRR